ncbi:flagellar biosynthesis protein FlhF [Clostridium omnivorum]|uniref:Flagellar biosynthesis protein FlhF n=1 Tax=Clostridium omnivorum TaxID=1604902 RepID=A0ABQ5NBF4_9CLOT|nr:flagellar biosynthesis protein FlhF [Clostridium sp. E14]GLC32365.1 flagellar biosynthesis regulator FlhF [Clostridium sp. E14]
MIIKRYIVSNMNEAMTRIRYELGKDAVIISQRKIKKPGLMGFFSKKVIEVTAAVENNKKKEEDMTESIEAIKKLMKQDGTIDSADISVPKKEKVTILREKEVYKPESQAMQSKQVDLYKEMQEMKNMLGNILDKSQGLTETGVKSDLVSKLEDNDVNDKAIKKILSHMEIQGEDLEEKEKARYAIESMISESDVKMEGSVVLVGPTGVGKTTTIAKLAGRLSLLEKKKVGLITIDTYRIGAVEQLKTYADIMNIPFKVVFTIKEMEAAVEAMSDCDVILIDTTGRSSKNAMQISELRAFVEKVNTDNIHLVISCTTKNKDIDSIVEGYKQLKYNNVIITKLDETQSYGSIINILEIAKKPISFITTGQNVPDDIRKPSTKEISNLILGEDSIC